MITAVSLNPAVDKVYFVDNFKPGNLYRVNNVVKSAGGKGINVARVVSILGENVTAIGYKAGETGEWLEQQLKGLGVHTCFIRVSGESRTNNNIIDRESGTETEVLEIGPTITQKNIDEFIDIFKLVLKNTDVLVCSGGLPEGIPVDFYGKLVHIAVEGGVKAILDTSNEMLIEGIKAKPYMVKPNLRELGKYVGRQLTCLEDVLEACRHMISQGVETVVASMGKQGALLVSKEEVLYALGTDVNVVNTIGSGDSMVAGLAVGLSRGCSREDMLRLGTACAVSNTQHMEIGYVTLEEVKTYLGQIEVRKI